MTPNNREELVELMGAAVVRELDRLHLSVVPNVPTISMFHAGLPYAESPSSAYTAMLSAGPFRKDGGEG